jgi:ribonuclease P protein component
VTGLPGDGGDGVTVEPTSAPRHTFPRAHRLSGKLAFTAVYDARSKQSRGPLAVFSRPNGLPHPRLGLSVSRRVGTAPRRNRIKRLLREAFRAHQRDLPVGYDLVIVVRPHEPMILAEYHWLLTTLMVASHAAWEKRASRLRGSEKPCQ